uniref:NADH-ubiquinone oxidoreductase chain 4 n=1 Tax=Utterbackia peninsularis TaxID=872316 RepID=F4ZG78_9BIVA|nr:NADH dehydrogenase subunit 4 [Utterbackia peninsularis]ADL62599.1 NADH dehydrogenase subunit 4 [Utterbackia peninsularis]
MLYSSYFLMGFLLLEILVNSKLSWWASIWTLALGASLMTCASYMNIGLKNSGYGGMFSYDEFSCAMIWLSAFICSLSLLSSNKVLLEGNMESSFLGCLLSLVGILTMCFVSNSLLIFYIFFECSLIPTFLIICGWGYQPERLLASKFMVLYTVGASLPLLMFIVCIVSSNGTLELSLLSLWNVEMKGFFLFVAAIMAFLVKIPMYGLHMWLPKAHVEAPVAGSMMLAGVLLKLGGYGLTCFIQFFKVWDSVFFSSIMSLCILGGVTSSVICCFQTDIKSLVAYSSVSHMSLVLCGFMSGSFVGFGGAWLLMVSHGLSSPGMFYLVSEMYSLFGSRSMVLVRGVSGNLMGVNLWLALMCGFNAAAPPSLSICSEVMLYISLMSYSLLFCGFLGSLSFLSCLYSWLLYCNTQTGGYPNWARSISSVFSVYIQSVVCSSLSYPLISLCFFL